MILDALDKHLENRIEQFEKNRTGFIAAAIAILVVGFYLIYTMVSSIVVNSNIHNMKELAEHDKQAIKNSIYFRQQEIINLSESLWRHRLLSVQGLHEHLRTTNDQYGMHRISVVDEAGVLFSSNGTTKEVPEYNELMEKNPKGFVARHGDKNGVIVIGAPVHPFRVENERFSYVIGEILARDLSDSMEINSYDGAGFSCVVDSQGDFIVAGEGRSETSLYKEFEGAKVDGFATPADFATALAKRQDITTTMHYEGVEYVLIASPTDYNWTIISIVPKSIFQSLSNKITGIFTILALVILGSITLVVMLLLRSRSRMEREAITAQHAVALEEKNIELLANQEQLQENQARLEEAAAEQEAHIEEVTTLNEQLQENQARLEEATAEQEAHIEEVTSLNEQLQENQARLEEAAEENKAQLEELRLTNDSLDAARREMAKAYSLIQGLSKEYTSVWMLQVPAMNFFVAQDSMQENIASNIKKTGETNYTNVIDSYALNFVHSEDREAFVTGTQYEVLKEGLKEHKIYKVNFRRIAAGKEEYCQFCYALAEANNLDGDVIMGFKNVDAEVREEQEQKRILAEARKQADAANEAKTSFLFNMSHDIRTPMNAIIGFRDLLEKHQEEPEKRADYLRKIEDSSTVLLSIINNVLEMARIEKGTIEIDESAWSAEQFNDTLYSVFHELMVQKGIEFTREVHVEHNYVLCDPIKLREIFLNILSNAYKYTNAGGKVHMKLEEVASEDPAIALYKTTISDTGIGMAEEFIPHIFEEFSREANSTETKIEGTGLGMPIVKRLLDLMGGTVKVTSAKGFGTTFEIIIPHKITDKSNLVEHFGVEVDPKLFMGKRILLAEDNELNAEIAIEILSEAGFMVDRVEDGLKCVEAVKRAENDYYDIILMDIQMPNMNGYEATRAIRKLSDSTKARIKILAMTANAFEEDKREAFRSGMNGHLAKPVNVHDLMKTLAAILG